jgi:hypothetical protein
MLVKKNKIKIKRIAVASMFIVMAAIFLFAYLGTITPTLAQTANDVAWGGREGEIGNVIELGSEDPRVIIAKIIRVFIGFLGIIAVILIMYAGWLWMTSEGNEEQLAKAKKVLKNAFIGLVIILLSFGIVTYLINLLVGATGGGLGPGPGPPGPGVGLGAIGSCTVESVYPEPGQKEVPRNTSIIVSFKEEVNLGDICMDVINVGGEDKCCEVWDFFEGKCGTFSKIVKENVRIFKTTQDDSCEWDEGTSTWINCDVSNVTGVSVATNDNKTFVFIPDDWLGSPSEYIWHSVHLTNEIRRIDANGGLGDGIFSTCSKDYFEWLFEVSNKVDLTPPQVKEYGVFPYPDNEKDEVGVATLAEPAEGDITVDDNNQIEVYADATVVSVTEGGGTDPADAVASVDNQESGDLTVTVGADDVTAILSKDAGSTLLGSAVFSGDSVTFPDYFALTVPSGIIVAGNEWTVNVTAQVLADTLTVGSTNYVFGEDILLGGDGDTTASNIADKIDGRPDLIALSAANNVDITVAIAGEAGNNIALSSSAAGLSVVEMSGGNNVEETTTVNGEKDQPRNSVIQVNFNEAISPLTVSGKSADVEDWIRVVNNLYVDGVGCIQNAECASGFCDIGGTNKCEICPGGLDCIPGSSAPALKANGNGCSSDRECLSFNCDGTCQGDVLTGSFEISNQYRTVEFISDDLCGVNGCGENIYCLPPDSHLQVELKAASLANCPGEIECFTKTPFVDCNGGICQNSANENYPLSTMLFDGIMDTALNSLDGNRDEDADGPQAQSGQPPLDENNSDPANQGDDYEWSFYISKDMDLTPPIINTISPNHTEADILLNDLVEIRFDKLMRSGSLRTGSKVIIVGENSVLHKNINIWSQSGSPIGYWITKEDLPANGNPTNTQAIINHSMFSDATSYRSQVGSGVSDIYQNCFKPSSSAACAGNPSCCGLAPTNASECP